MRSLTARIERVEQQQRELRLRQDLQRIPQMTDEELIAGLEAIEAAIEKKERALGIRRQPVGTDRRA